MDVSRTKIHPFLRQVFLGGGSIYYCISPWIYTCTSILFGAAFWYIIYPCNRNRKLIVLYFFFRLWSPGRMRPRRLPGSCLLTRDLHGNKHSAACYTSTVSNTPPTSVYRDECGFFAMGSNPAIQKNPNSWRDQRTNMCCFVSGIF